MSNSRIRFLFAGAASLLFLTACFGGPTGSDNKQENIVLPKVEKPISFPNAVFPKGDGKGKCPKGTTIAYVGVVTGTNAAFGKPLTQAFNLAIKQHNDNNPDCQVTGRIFDTEGAPNKASGVVAQVTADKSIVGIVGPSFSGETQATGPTFDSAGLVTISPSATLTSLSSHGWKTFFRTVAPDVTQSAGVVVLLEKIKAKKTFIIGDDSAYGVALSALVRDKLGSSKVAGTDGVISNNRDFSSVVAKIKSANPDSVFYAGYYSDAVPLFQQIRGAGYKGYLVVPDGSVDPELGKAGSAAVGVYGVCPCVDESQVAGFSSDFEKEYGKAPGIYASSAYDAATILLRGIDTGHHSRPALLDYVKTYDGYGVSGHRKFRSNGDPFENVLYFYRFNEKGIPEVVGNYDVPDSEVSSTSK